MKIAVKAVCGMSAKERKCLQKATDIIYEMCMKMHNVDREEEGCCFCPLKEICGDLSEGKHHFRPWAITDLIFNGTIEVDPYYEDEFKDDVIKERG